MFNPSSPHYFERPQNIDAYKQWVEFRVDSINNLGRKLSESARQVRPDLKIGYMFLSDATVEPGRTREYQAQDLHGAIHATDADFVVIQDAWQDWTKPDLQPDFARIYAEAYLPQIQEVKPGIPVLIHADVGSVQNMKRSGLWMRQTAAIAQVNGLNAAAYYEFTLNLDRY
jgi:hypothetical protein